MQRLNDDELEAWEEDYEDHLLREPFSVLYAMNHQVRAAEPAPLAALHHARRGL